MAAEDGVSTAGGRSTSVLSNVCVDGVCEMEMGLLRPRTQSDDVAPSVGDWSIQRDAIPVLKVRGSARALRSPNSYFQSA